MAVYEHVTTFHGLDVVNFGSPDSPAHQVAWRLAEEPYEPGEPLETLIPRFLDTVDTSDVTALVIGPWGEVYENDPSEAIAQLAGVAAQLPALTGIFFGDIVMEEAEISWIKQGDVTPLLRAFPKLTELVVRGGDGLELEPVRHETLQVLRFESGGLPAGVVKAVAASQLPALRKLQLWLGVEDYGADWELEDLAPFVGERFGELRYLGLQNSTQQDEIAELVAGSPVVARLETLDLSMGSLTDKGAEKLLADQRLSGLQTLDLHHHYLSEGMQQQVLSRLAGVQVDLSDPEEPSDYDGRIYYYTAVAE